jgi:hypothetical protein
MPPTTNPPAYLQEAAARLLRQQAEVEATAGRGLDAVGEVFGRLGERLAALVGESGIAAVLDRALVARGAAAGAATHLGDEVARVTAYLRGRPDRDAEAAALLVAFLVLVGGFLGDAVTSGVLHDLWPEVFPAPGATT